MLHARQQHSPWSVADTTETYEIARWERAIFRSTSWDTSPSIQRDLLNTLSISNSWSIASKHVESKPLC